MVTITGTRINWRLIRKNPRAVHIEVKADHQTTIHLCKGVWTLEELHELMPTIVVDCVTYWLIHGNIFVHPRATLQCINTQITFNKARANSLVWCSGYGDVFFQSVQLSVIDRRTGGKCPGIDRTILCKGDYNVRMDR